MPSAGAVSFVQSQFAGSLYRNNLRFNVTGTAAATVDFSSRTVTVTLQVQAPSGSGVANINAVVPCTIVSSFSYFTCSAGSVSVWGRFFGPNATEIGIGFGVSDAAFGSLPTYHIHGQVIGYR